MLSPQVFCLLYLYHPPFFFSFVIAEGLWAGLYARASARYTEHVLGRTVKGTVRREGCCGRCSPVNVQVSCLRRDASPATMQRKKKKKKKPNEQVRRTGVSLSFRRRRGRLLWRTWLCDAPPKGSKLDGWGRGRFIFATRCAVEVLRWIWVEVRWAEVCWRVKVSFEGGPFSQYLWPVLVYGLGVAWCSGTCAGLILGETPGRELRWFLVGKETSNRFPSFRRVKILSPV